jgi:cellulose synthase/poly-beta-1,6-N-acetylglucosamine synthase-like glycosyltransferase
VVADNCADRTVEIAASAGATVHERHDPEHRAKGYALKHGLRQLQNSEPMHEACVMVDAGSILSLNFLEVMNRHLAQRHRAVQSYYGVVNQGESWSSALRHAASALYHGLRPRGRDALGFLAAVRNNGMRFSRGGLDSVDRDAFALAEDVELHLTLVEAGIRVAYAAEATVTFAPTRLITTLAPRLPRERHP